MSSVRDPDAVIAAWLDEGPTELPDPNRRAIVTATRTIKQRRGFGPPWRLPMNGNLRLALMAATVLVVAVGTAYVVVPGLTNRAGGGVGATPSSSASAPPVPTPAPAGSISLTDSGCAWAGKPDTLTGPIIVTIDARNETDDFGLFALYKLRPGRDFEEALAWLTEAQAAVAAGEEGPETDMASFQQEIGLDSGSAGRLAATVSGGTYGIICTTHPEEGSDDLLTLFLAGPLDIE